MPRDDLRFSCVMPSDTSRTNLRRKNSRCGNLLHTRGRFYARQSNRLNLLLSTTWQSLFLMCAIRFSNGLFSPPPRISPFPPCSSSLPIHSFFIFSATRQTALSSKLYRHAPHVEVCHDPSSFSAFLRSLLVCTGAFFGRRSGLQPCPHCPAESRPGRCTFCTQFSR